jgi:hypothetical protein
MNVKVKNCFINRFKGLNLKKSNIFRVWKIDIGDLSGGPRLNKNNKI